jgi:hypothetical protein
VGGLLVKNAAQSRNRTIVSECQENGAAAARYDDAISENRTPLLLEATNDSFSLLLGNLGPKEGVRVTIALVESLQIDDKDNVVLELPYTLMIPKSKIVQVKCALRNEFDVSCASNHIALSETVDGMLIVNVASTISEEVKLVLKKRLQVDNAPSILVQENERSELCAIVSFVPRFEEAVGNNNDCEIVFIVDRSGSMHGDRIKATVNALQTMLRSLPPNVSFDIVSFGDKFLRMFEYGAALLMEESFSFATAAVTKFEADMGGTELLKPLEAILEVPATRSRKIVVITDGEVGDSEALTSTIRRLSQNTTTFALGIGNGCSSHTLRCLAKAGKGTFEVADEKKERLETVVARMLHRVLSPMAHNVKVEFGENVTVLDCVQTAETVCCGERFHAYALISSAPATGDVVLSYEMGNVHKSVKCNDGIVGKGDLVHRAMAKSIVDTTDDSERARQYALKYSFASQYTSLIAVDPEQQERARLRVTALKVKLIDGTTKSMILPGHENVPVESVMHSIGDKMGLANTEEYGLFANGRWLNARSSLAEQGVTDVTTVELKKRFFCHDSNVDRSDPVQLHLIYQQSRDSVLSGALPIRAEDAAALAASQLQVEVGNYDPAVHTREWLAAKRTAFLPSAHAAKMDIKEVERKWMQLVNTNSTNASFRYTQATRALPTYGITTFDVKMPSKGGKKLKKGKIGTTRDAVP